MPARSVLTIAVLCALLILGAGVGSAFLLTSPHPPAKTTSQPRANVPLGSPTAEQQEADSSPVALGDPAPISPTPASASESDALPTAQADTATPAPTQTPTHTWTPAPTDTPFPTRRPEKVGGPVLLANNHKGVCWVTLQAGHWNEENLPEELAHLTNNTGTYAAGVAEVDVNLAVAKLTAQRLYERGYSVEVLDATIPPNYTTDLFLALHADGNAYSYPRGFKAVSPWDWGATRQSEAFVSLLYEEYGKATGLPSDPKTSAAMANYYAFNPLKYMHALNPSVPAALLEMGFITNPQDRQVLATEQDRVAWGIANAVDRYFHSGAAGPTPSPYPSFTRTPLPTRTPTSTRTSTSTSTATSTGTATPVPPLPSETALSLTETATVIRHPTATRTPRLPTATGTASPTATPLEGVTLADGSWLPPVSPNGRSLPPLGSNSAPVLLSIEDDDPHGGYMLKRTGWHPHIWRQYYFPKLGRSIWIEGEAIPPRE